MESKSAPVCNGYDCQGWTIKTYHSHILESIGPPHDRFVSQLRIPRVPEMIFAENSLAVCHTSGCGLTFVAVDALQNVDPEHMHVEVAVADSWRAARSNSEYIGSTVKPFDWTFSTDYQGTLVQERSAKLQVLETDKTLNIDKLKEREKILFFDDVTLFEDELSDHGCSALSVKIRVMPSGFFILQRQYIRVDDVLVRINDTRYHHEFENSFIFREFSVREKSSSELPAK